MIFITVSIILTMLSVIPGYASWLDYDYEGALDKKTGDPTDIPDNTEQGVYDFGNGVSFDKAEKCYCYSVNEMLVRSNIPAGVVTSSSVSFDVPQGMLARLYRDGKEISEPDLKMIRDIGSYVIVFGSDNDLKVEFTIVGEAVGALTLYRLPVGFYLTSLYIDGEAVEDASSSVVDMSAEGIYQINYCCPDTGVHLDLNVLVDHTPPVLKLEAVTDGSAGGPVDISDLEKGVSARIALNGSYIDYSPVLTKSGEYVIRLQDPAGNTTQYQFTIRVYFNFNSVAFIVILVLLVAAVGIFLVISRKRLRIR